MRYNARNVANLAQAVYTYMVAHGVFEPNYVVCIERGSKAQGNAWGLTLRHPETREHIAFPGVSLWGCFTAAEAFGRIDAAYTMLITMVEVMEGRRQNL